MLELKRTSAKHQDFIALVQELDQLLAVRDGEDHAFYHQFNGLQDIPYVLIAYWNGTAVACGTLKPFDETSAEVKRMFTSPDYRKKGIATDVLTALESWAKELCYQKCILETGTKLPEAIALYEKNGYSSIPNYGQYEGVETSVCFEKVLN